MSHGLTATVAGPWCGPTAIAAVTGASPEAIEKLVVDYRKHVPAPHRSRNTRGRPVRAMWVSEIGPVLCKLGWRATVRIGGPRITFAQWQRQRDRSASYIVLITGHFVAVSGDEFADTRHHVPIKLNAAPYRRSRVRAVWQVEKM